MGSRKYDKSNHIPNGAAIGIKSLSKSEIWPSCGRSRKRNNNLLQIKIYAPWRQALQSSIDVYGIDKISSEIASIEIKYVQALFPNVSLDNLLLGNKVGLAIGGRHQSI